MAEMQLNQMNALLKEYEEHGLIALGFPSNIFNLQEPAASSEILNCYKYVRPGNNWIPHKNFHIMDKVDVNGQNQIPFYDFLKSNCDSSLLEIGQTSYFQWSPIRRNDISWNYAKFVIDKHGNARYRLPPSTKPLDMEALVQGLLIEK